MAWTTPETAKTIPIRPLNKGMVTEMTSQQLPSGSFTLLRNMYGGTVGPRRYPGSVQYAGNQTFEFTPHSYFTNWRTDGSQTNILLCDHATYEVDPTVGYSEIVWKNTTGSSITVSGVTVTGVDTKWLIASEDVLKDDVLYVFIGGDMYYSVIDNILSDTILILKTSSIPDGTYTAPNFEIHRALKPHAKPFADYVNIGNYTLIATGYGSRPLVKLDAGSRTMSYWMDTPAKYPDGVHPVYPSLVAYFDDLVWIGDTYDEVDGRCVNRIRWSTYADITNFNNPTSYVDLPYTSSHLMRLVPLGDMLIAYFRDCIFVGRRTNYPNAPVAFFQAESLGLGLTGMKAILPFYGSHIIITKLGPYIFDGSNLQPLPCTILQDFIRDNINSEYNRIVFDEERGLILFCLADKDKQIYKEYVYDVIGKVWSIFDIPTQMVDSPNVTTYTTIDGLSPQEINDLNQEIDSYGSYQDKKTLFWTYANRMYRTSTSAIMFFEQIPVTVEIVTQDFDFDDPDNIKSFHRLGIKIDYRVPPVDQITFQVQGSVNRGRVWKTLGTLVINVGEDEGYVNFRLTGSTARFRLLSASVVSPYNITEITIKTRVSGSDESLNSQQH